MKALTPLIYKLCNHFSLHNSRLETLCAIIIGLMSGGNVHHVSLSRYLSHCSPSSALRRVERFFQNQVLNCGEYALSIVDFLGFNGKFTLCLDRTNWQFGDKDINNLVLSWRTNKQISLPLFFEELGKAGNSSTSERICLLEQFNQTFGFDRIESLIADREFVGDSWFKSLIKAKIPFFIRVKENSLVPYGKNPIHVKDLFFHLKVGQTRIVEKEMYGSTVYFAGTRANNKQQELVIVMTNKNWPPRKILYKYRDRWSIEEMFKKLKTSGFHWENTQMKKSERLTTLLVIMSISALLLYYMGTKTKIPWKKTLNCHLWSLFKQGMINFQHIAAKGMIYIIESISDAILNAHKILQLKISDG